MLESPHILDKTLEVIPAAKKSIVRFVTSNPLKTREINALLEEGGLDLPFEVATLDIELPEIQDDPINASNYCVCIYIDGVYPFLMYVYVCPSPSPPSLQTDLH